MRILALIALALMTAGCVTSGEVVSFRAKPGQEGMIRDGVASIVSTGRNTVVSVSPASRQTQVGQRPVFLVHMRNISRQPVTFMASDLAVEQLGADGSSHLHVVSFEEAAQEERQKATNRAILGAIVAGANSYSAGNNYWRQARASDQNAQMASDIAYANQAGAARVETMMLKSHTMLPGEQHVGQIMFQPPNGDGQKSYVIHLKVGSDVHDITVNQGVPKA